MRIAFINDHPFHHNLSNDEIYTSGTLDSNFWNRYLDVFSSISVVGRGIKTHSLTSKYSLSSAKNVSFNLLYDVKGGFDYFLKRGSIKRFLTSVIKDVDLVVIRVPSSIGNIAFDVCKKLKINYIVEVVGCILDVSKYYGNPFIKILGQYNFKKMQEVVKNSSGAIYVTEKFLQSRYPCNTDKISASNVIINSLDELILDLRIKKIENHFGIFKIGMIGALNVPYKGHQVLLEASNKLKQLGLKFKVYLVGGGEKNYIEHLCKKLNIEDNVEIVGKLKKGDEILKFLDDIDLYVHPSLTEGLPRSVIEAMSRACPILVSDVGGLPELVNANNIHKAGDSEKLAFQMFELLNCSENLKSEAQLNFQKAKEFSEEKLKKRRFEFFNKIKNKLES